MEVITYLIGIIKRCSDMEVLGRKRIGTMLVNAGKIDSEQLENSLQNQKKKPGYLGQIFVSNGYLSEKELYFYLSQQFKVPFLSLGYFKIDKSLMSLFTEGQIRSKVFLPLFKLDNALTIAVSDPLDLEPMNLAREVTGLKVELVLASTIEIESSIDLHYGISSFISGGSGNVEATKITDYFDESKVVELVDSIISQSHRYQSSDVHIAVSYTHLRAHET